VNYLELVNRAIQEAGKDQDDLTAGTFASPPDPRMFNRFKNWVNESYQQLQMVRGQWDFQQNRASVFVYPAIYVETGSRAPAPASGYVYQGQDTDFEFSVLQTTTHSGAWNAGTAKATLYFDEDFEGADFKFNELFNELSPTPASGVFRSKGWGRYDFMADGQLTDMLRPLEETFMIQSTGGSSIQDNDEGIGLSPIRFVDWDLWQPVINGWAGGRGMPALITRAPDGDYEMYPRPNKAYVLNFTYNSTEGTLSAYSDSPTNLPTRFHMMLVWMAVAKCGMYERDRAMVSRAETELNKYRQALETYHMPLMNFAPSAYNYE
jgi:hypothetical protein